MNLRLFHAVVVGNLHLTKSLIQDGADFLARDYNGMNCLHIAARKNHMDIVDYLLELEEDHMAKIVKDGMGDTLMETPMDVSKKNNIVARRSGAHSLRRCRSTIVQQRSNAECAILAHFPQTVAMTLMSSRPVAPVYKPSVSIFFSDVVDYTVLRGNLDPLVLLDMLNRLFAQLDRLASLHGVQRIDTVDGCYIAAANFSSRQPNDHALRLARFAAAAVAA